MVPPKYSCMIRQIKLQRYCKYIILQPMNIKINWDGLGIFTSLLCAIHCAVLPIVLPTLSLFGVGITHNNFFEWSMIGIAFIVGMYALIHGYKKHHHKMLPLGIFMVGFILLIAKQLFVHEKLLFLLMAVSLIIIAHLMNYKFCTRNHCNSPHHKH